MPSATRTRCTGVKRSLLKEKVVAWVDAATSATSNQDRFHEKGWRHLQVEQDDMASVSPLARDMDSKSELFRIVRGCPVPKEEGSAANKVEAEETALQGHEEVWNLLEDDASFEEGESGHDYGGIEQEVAQRDTPAEQEAVTLRMRMGTKRRQQDWSWCRRQRWWRHRHSAALRVLR